MIRLMDILNRTYIQTASWLGSHQQFDGSGEFARDDDFLLVAA
jgi:hypothetical protein